MIKQTQAELEAQLVVAQQKIEEVRKQLEVQTQKKSQFRKRLWLPEFRARPIFGYVGLRGSKGLRSSPSPFVMRASREQDVEQVFEVPELDAQVALRIPRVQGEQYELTGTVTQHAQLVEKTRVTLRGQRGSTRRRTTNEAGFFAFRQLPPDTYRLRIIGEEGAILISDVVLATDEF